MAKRIMDLTVPELIKGIEQMENDIIDYGFKLTPTDLSKCSREELIQIYADTALFCIDRWRD